MEIASTTHGKIEEDDFSNWYYIVMYELEDWEMDVVVFAPVV